jgi:hypothetical protein
MDANHDNLTQEFSSTSEFIEVGISCLDAAEKSMKDAETKKTVTDAKSRSMPTKVSPNKETLKPSSSGSARTTTHSTRTSVSKGHKDENEVQVLGTALSNQEEEPTCVVNTGKLANRPRHSFSPKYTPNKKKKMSMKEVLKDPRGLPLDWKLPDTGYCAACRCKFSNCHEVVFGEFCELYIVREVEQAHWYLVDEYIEEIFTGKFSEALQFKVYEVMGSYDGRKGGYKLPECVRKNALERSLQYGNFHTYHYSKYDKLEEGHFQPNWSHNHLFERQLVKDGHYAAMMKSDGEDEAEE